MYRRKYTKHQYYNAFIFGFVLGMLVMNLVTLLRVSK